MQKSAQKESSFQELGLKPFEDPIRKQYNSRINTNLPAISAELSQVTTPHKNTLAEGTRSAIGQSNHRRMHVSTS